MEHLPPGLRRDLILSVGTHRNARPLSPVEVARGIEEALQQGATVSAVAESLQLSDATMVQRFRRLLALAPGIQYLVGWPNANSSLTLTAGSEIARLPSMEVQQQLVSAVLEHNLKSGEIRQIVQILLKSQKSAKESIESVVRIRPQVVKRHVLVGAIEATDIKGRLGKLSQKARDELLNRAVSRQVPELPPWSGRLSPERFTLIGDLAFAKRIQSLPGGFESALNAFLEVEVNW